MTYAVGQPIAAANFMSFRGANAPNVAYTSSGSATNAIAALIGVGYACRGYGLTTTVLPAVTTGSVVTAAQWNDLYAAMSTINTYTGSALVLPDNVTAGTSVIQAEDGSSGRPNLPTLVSTLDSNRLTAAVSQVTTTSELTSVLSTSWTVSVTHQFTMTFASVDQARYFFNTGGQMYASASRIGGSATDINMSMTDLLTQMGTIKVGAKTTTYTGSGGTVASVGYYGLSSSGFTQLFTHTGSGFPPPYSYSNISYTLSAMVNTDTTNGGNGNIVTFKSVFAAAAGTLDGTLTSTIQQLKSDTISVAAPTWSTTIPL